MELQVHFAFLFPGQGSQHPGMGENYLREFPYIKEYFLQANEILHFDILELCLNGPEDKLNLTVNAQPAILILSFCAYQILQKETGIQPFLAAGHSLGEISALCCSGAINFADAVKIVKKRGELMQAAIEVGGGAMYALQGIRLDAVEKIICSGVLNGKVVISNINSRDQIVISGKKDSVVSAATLAKDAGAAVVPLKVSAPFHSPYMKSAAAGLEQELNNYTYSNLNFPVISNVTCKPYLDQNDIIPLLTEQVTHAVNWLKIMEYIGKTRVDITLELPPKKILTGFYKNQDSKISHYTFDQLEEIKNLISVAI
jgi:[acyl-carrier-protein] S-malonyltransferase